MGDQNCPLVGDSVPLAAVCHEYRTCMLHYVPSITSVSMWFPPFHAYRKPETVRCSSFRTIRNDFSQHCMRYMY